MFIPHSFVANFVSYICAKYYLKWSSFRIVIMKLIGVNFFETQCTCTGIVKVRLQYGPGIVAHM